MSIGVSLWIPIILGIFLGVVPALVLWSMAGSDQTSFNNQAVEETEEMLVKPLGVVAK